MGQRLVRLAGEGGSLRPPPTKNPNLTGGGELLLCSARPAGRARPAFLRAARARGLIAACSSRLLLLQLCWRRLER